MARRKPGSPPPVPRSERVKEWEPWKYSTGPRTKAGKARSCLNGLKHGLYSKDQAIRLYGGVVAEIEAITTSPVFLDPNRLAALKAKLPLVAEMIEDVKEA